MSEMQSVASDAERRIRMAEFTASDRDRAVSEEEGRRANRDFVQVYPKGWRRLQSLIRTNPSAARVYAFLAEHVDGIAGVVVVTQELMAAELGVHKRTIIRLTQELEKANAIARIRVGTGVYAYALDPTEVWRSWDDKKDCAAFVTRTLVLKSDKANGQVRRKLKVMLGEPELPLND